MTNSSMAEQELLVNEELEDTQEGKYLTFNLGKEGYGFEIRHVNEIIGIQEITDLPDVPHYVKGVINLRGKVIPVIDVRLRFGMQEIDYTERTCIVVVNVNNMLTGLIVDEVSEVVEIPSSNIEETTSLKSGGESKYIKAFGKIGEDVKILLNIGALLFGDQLEELSKAVESCES